jgi:hypothetical protein
MFDSLASVLYALLGLAIFCDVTAIAVAACLRDRERLERLIDLHTDVFAAVASTIIGATKFIRPKQDGEALHRPNDSKQIKKMP